MNDRLQYRRKEYKEREIAYLAGIVDGEGSIYIGNFSCNPVSKLPYYQTNIQVTNTDKELIDWLCNTFGGLFSKRTQKQHASNSRKQAYMWTASGERLTHLCEIMMPYLICKRRQAEIMLKMRATYTKNGAPRGRQGVPTLDEGVRELRQSLMEEMRNLHIRTHSYKHK
jgi:hypothetical protein